MFDIRITLKDGRVITQKEIGLVHLHWADDNMEHSELEKVFRSSDEAMKNEEIEQRSKMLLSLLSLFGGTNNESK